MSRKSGRVKDRERGVMGFMGKEGSGLGDVLVGLGGMWQVGCRMESNTRGRPALGVGLGAKGSRTKSGFKARSI